MPDRLGNAAILWSATSDASGDRVHLLQAPLRQLRAGKSMQTWQRQSIDRSVLENVSVGDGSDELRGRVRYDHDAKGLSDVIVAGSQGKTLRYIPDLSDPDVDFQCDLVSPLAPFTLDLDQQRGILGDQSIELALRLTDQTPFDPLYHGSAVLFSYRAGGSLEASSSFGRVTSSSAPATYADISVGGGLGNLSTAGSNQARVHWMSTALNTGPRSLPTLLMEGTRSNDFTKSEELDDAVWTKTRATVTADATNAPDGTATADKLVEDATAAATHEFSRNTPALTDDTQQSYSLFAKAAERTEIKIVCLQKDGTSASAWFDLSAGTVGTLADADGLIEKYTDGWYRCILIYDSSNGGSTPSVVVRMGSGSETSSYSGDAASGIYVWGNQFEVDGAVSSSYMPTDTATTTRNSDTLPFPFPPRPQAMTVYARFIEMGTVLVSGSRVLHIGGSLFSDAPRFLLQELNGGYAVRHDNGTTNQVVAITSPVPSVGDTVELVAHLNVDGSVKLQQSVNSGLVATSTETGAATLHPAWASSLLYLNSGGTSNYGFAAFRNIAIHRGVQTIDTMRRVAGVI